MHSQNKYQAQLNASRFTPTKNALPQEQVGAQNGGGAGGSGNSQDKFWKMVNVASNALFKVADVQNPNDVNEVAVKLLGLFQNIRGEYMRRRGLEETRKQSIREIQSNPLNVAPIFNRSLIPPPLTAAAAAAPVPTTSGPAPTFGTTTQNQTTTPVQPTPLPQIYLPMKQEEVNNMTQEQAQALLGNLLNQLMKEQRR
jgi:hypothetical protein